MRHLIVIEYEDWAALYVDADKELEDHSISIQDLIRAADNDAFTLEKIPSAAAELLFYTMVTDTGSWPANTAELRAAIEAGS